MSCIAQVKKSYEELGMTPEQIAEDQSLELAAVKAALMQNSSLYRKDCGNEEEEDSILNFSREEQIQIKRGLLEVALGAEDEGTRLKALMYCRDDAKGRRDAVRAIANTAGSFTIFQFNQNIQKAREMANAAKQKVIDV